MVNKVRVKMTKDKKEDKASLPKMANADINKPLPKGWIQNASKSHPDRLYYFNPETGQSVWNLDDISDTKCPDNKPDTKRPVTRSLSKEHLNQQTIPSTSSKKRTCNEPNKSAKFLKRDKSDAHKMKSPKTPKANSTSKKSVNSNSCKSIGKLKALEQLETSIKSMKAKLGRKSDLGIPKASNNQLEGRKLVKAKRHSDVKKTPKVSHVPESKKQPDAKKLPPAQNLPKNLSQVKKSSDAKQSSKEKKKICIKLPEVAEPVKQDLVSDIINTSNVLNQYKNSKNYKIPKNKDAKESSNDFKESSNVVKKSSNVVKKSSNVAKKSSNDNTAQIRAESSNDVTAQTQAASNAKLNDSLNRLVSNTNVIESPESLKDSKDEFIPMFADEMDWEENSAHDALGLCVTASTCLDVTATDDIVLPADVDMFEFEDYHQQTEGIVDYIRVVDTNIYIDDLKLVESVVKKEILAVPWTVIQELDGLKKNSNSSVSGSAREAGRWLSLQVKAKRSGIIFQKMSDVATVAGAEETADDRILLYCLYLKDLYGENVSIVTNDTNLSTKALIEEVEAFTAKTLTDEYKSKQDLTNSQSQTSDVKTNSNQAKNPTTSHIDNDNTSTRRSRCLNTSSQSRRSSIEFSTSSQSRRSSSTSIQDKVIKEKKDECDIDCDLVLTCLTHIWHILTVITQGLLICAGKVVLELVSPSYPVTVEQAPVLYNSVLGFIMQIGVEYEVMLAGSYTLNNLHNFCSLLNNFKKSLNILSHEAWKNTPIINQNQLESFLKKERLKAENGFKQLVSIREELSRCNNGAI